MSLELMTDLREHLGRLQEELSAVELCALETEAAVKQASAFNAETEKLEEQLEKVNQRIATEKSTLAKKRASNQRTELDKDAMGRIATQLEVRRRHLNKVSYRTQRKRRFRKSTDKETHRMHAKA